MTINLHNYEEFFILYVDNELKASDRQQVEEFIQKNPDLREELNILMQYKLVPDDDIVFKDKDQLIRHEATSPSQDIPAELREWLLLYVDGELNAGDRINMEDQLALDPAAKKELGLLLRTKLQPEEISFPDKASLYRSEKVPERILGIPPRWWKVAAAAILLLSVGLTVGIVMNKKSGNDKLVKATPANQQTKPVERQTDPGNVAAEKKEDLNNSPIPSNTEKNTERIASVTTRPNKQNNKKASVIGKKLIPTPVNIDEEKSQPVVADNHPNPANNNQEAESTGTIKSRGKEISEEEKANENINSQEFTAKIPVTPNTTHALYPETASREDLAQTGGKKSRFRGLFRKLTRTFEKNTNINAADDDRVLIGGLAIKL